MSYKNDVKSLKRKALPIEIVCAVSPAQKRPFGFMQIHRNTEKCVNLKRIAVMTEVTETHTVSQ